MLKDTLGFFLYQLVVNSGGLMGANKPLDISPSKKRKRVLVVAVETIKHLLAIRAKSSH